MDSTARRLVLAGSAVLALLCALLWAGRRPSLPVPDPGLDLNSSSAAELAILPGLGPELARRLVAERGRGGPYASVGDLGARVHGLGPARAAQLAPYLKP